MARPTSPGWPQQRSSTRIGWSFAADSAEGQELARDGEGIYSLILKTNALERARALLRSKSHRPETEGADTIVLGADQAFGIRLGFPQRTPPNDPPTRAEPHRLTVR